MQNKFFKKKRIVEEKEDKHIKKMVSKYNYDELNNEILSHRLSDIVGKFVHLKREGAGRHKCCCPFHHEKTPSFHLDDYKGLWHCFGCGEGGNIFTFIQKIKNCDFPQAVDDLCEMCGIDKTKYITVQNAEEVEKTKNFYQTMEIVAQYYKDNLLQNQEALDYLLNIRELQQETLEEFNFGLADDDINKLINYCKLRDISEEQLVNCGILKESDKFEIDNNGERIKNRYLFFKNRIMIPIHNQQNKIVAFGGRIYKTNDDGAKYLNSGENWYFKKGNLLFNFNRVKKKLNKDNYVIIVEGYMDAIALWQNDIQTAIAPLGTSITDFHLKTIFSYCQQPVFLFDSDTAGQKASVRACEMIFSMIKVGIVPKFCTLKGAKDVDEFLKKYTKQELFEQLEQADEINKFIFKNKTKQFNLENPNQVAILQKTLLELTNKITDPVLKENYKNYFHNELKKITLNNEKNNNKLANKNNVKTNFKKTSFYNFQDNQKYETPALNTDSVDFLEKKIIALFLSSKELLEDIDNNDNFLSRLSPKNQQLLTNLLEKEENLKKNFCNKYLKEVLEHNNLMETNLNFYKKIFENLSIQWELAKIDTSNLPNEIKLEERKKIIMKKKEMLKDF